MERKKGRKKLENERNNGKKIILRNIEKKWNKRKN